MKVAIVHYHIKPGGVTRVIENTVKVLLQFEIQPLVLAEEAAKKGILAGHSSSVPSLGYSKEFDVIEARDLKRHLEDACREQLGSLPDIWHVHNHCLAKNPMLTWVVSEWAKEGQKMLLQVHDFAEDGRPENYEILMDELAKDNIKVLDETLYPTGSHIEYATINQRDLKLLHKAGLPSDRSQVLSNPIWFEPGEPTESSKGIFSGKRMILYPTRSIRRKNMGEFIFWATLAQGDEIFGTSLPPNNPDSFPIYNLWKQLVKELKLPIEFELGKKHAFGDLVASADSFITTSIAEGFGLAFLEPFVGHKPLVGRNLPEITHDFTSVGITLENLYTDLPIPMDWVDRKLFEETFEAELRQYYQAYGQAIGADILKQGLESVIIDDHVDFGRLDETLQSKVIRQVHQSTEKKAYFQPRLIDQPLAEEKQAANRSIISEQFCLESYGNSLAELYKKLSNSRVSDVKYLNSQDVLRVFLDPARFYLLRT